MQQQNNCGLFSIAAAFHAAADDDLGGLTFDEKSHLIKCFERGKFLDSLRSPARPTPHYLDILIFCARGRPDSFQDMIACEACKSWFHFRCAGIALESGLQKETVKLYIHDV